MTDTTQTLSSNENEPVAFDERTRRVMELRKQVREGTYRPDPEEVAKAMLAEWSRTANILPAEPPMSIDTAEGRKDAAARFLVQKSAPEQVRETALTA